MAIIAIICAPVIFIIGGGISRRLYMHISKVIIAEKKARPLDMHIMKDSVIPIQNQYEYTKKALYVMLPFLIIFIILYFQLQPPEPEDIAADPSLIFKPTPISVPIIIRILSAAFVSVTIPHLIYYVSFRLSKGEYNLIIYLPILGCKLCPKKTILY